MPKSIVRLTERNASRRTAKDFAIEHAGYYLADAVENILKSPTLIMDAEN